MKARFAAYADVVSATAGLRPIGNGLPSSHTRYALYQHHNIEDLGMADNNAAFIQYADLRNRNWSLQERLNVEGIYVSSRDELVSAQDFIINTLKRPTIVRFATPLPPGPHLKPTSTSASFISTATASASLPRSLTARKATITISCAAIPAAARWITTFLFAQRLS
ncbi:hypothetical protein M5585_23785 [Serratia ureilytica]